MKSQPTTCAAHARVPHAHGRACEHVLTDFADLLPNYVCARIGVAFVLWRSTLAKQILDTEVLQDQSGSCRPIRQLQRFNMISKAAERVTAAPMAEAARSYKAQHQHVMTEQPC